MTGINIIEEHIYRELDTGSVIITVGLVLLTIMVAVIVNLDVFRGKSTIVKIITLIVSLVLTIFFIGGYVNILIESYNKTYVEYTVTIDDTVGFNEFNNKYEIITVNGNEYRVREKE
jgi:hypothetical protein